MSKTKRPLTASQNRDHDAKKAREALKEKLWTWAIILLLVAAVLFSLSQVISHHL